MDATRARFGSAIEWVLAAAVILAVVAVGSIVVREMRTVGAGMPVSAREAQPTSVAPAGVPARAVSVPVLLLTRDRSVRVGDTLSAIAARLGREAEVGMHAVEPSPFGERVTRSYDCDGTRFVLVFEPREARGEPRVAAIYLQ